MAYISGTVDSMASLKSAIESEAVARGWSISSGILSKNGCFFEIQSREDASSYLAIYAGTGQTGDTLDDQAQDGVAISSISGSVFSFPLSYEIHSFDDVDEIYCIINYGLSYYQTIAFGISDVAGIGGTGSWLTGSYRASGAISSDFNGNAIVSVREADCGLNTVADSLLTGPFWTVYLNNRHSSFVHTGLDSTGWKENTGSTLSSGTTYGIMHCTGVLTSLPNLSNQSSPLIPIRVIQVRNIGGATIVASLSHARYIRIDNVSSGELITLGSDQWKCYPLLKKNTSFRNGFFSPTGSDHTGTFGFAIRYQGA